MNEVRDQNTWQEKGTSREAWSARYEQLRAGWFSHDIGWGQTLFIRQGMVAWMKAWSTTTPSPSEAQADEAGPQQASSNAVVICGERQRELTWALANLILHRQQEVLV